jgi:hypothetical protein
VGEQGEIFFTAAIASFAMKGNPLLDLRKKRWK